MMYRVLPSVLPGERLTVLPRFFSNEIFLLLPWRRGAPAGLADQTATLVHLARSPREPIAHLVNPSRVSSYVRVYVGLRESRSAYLYTHAEQTLFMYSVYEDCFFGRFCLDKNRFTTRYLSSLQLARARR